MPTYNNAIDDAIRAVVKHWETLDDLQVIMPVMLKIVGLLNNLKRPTRAKRKSRGHTMTHHGNSEMGMSKHRKSGHTSKSPKYRYQARLEAERTVIKDKSRIVGPKSSTAELFHPTPLLRK